jgi:hypothetical protein
VLLKSGLSAVLGPLYGGDPLLAQFGHADHRKVLEPEARAPKTGTYSTTQATTLTRLQARRLQLPFLQRASCPAPEIERARVPDRSSLTVSTYKRPGERSSHPAATRSPHHTSPLLVFLCLDPVAQSDRDDRRYERRLKHVCRPT